MNYQAQDDDRTLTIYGQHGRDVGKTFSVGEIDPLTLSGYVLRLVSALRVESYESLVDQLSGAKEGAAPIDAIMQILRGADPRAVHDLITELVTTYVRVSPDPKHPGVMRALMPSDIREIKTLGDILMGIFKVNFGA